MMWKAARRHEWNLRKTVVHQSPWIFIGKIRLMHKKVRAFLLRDILRVKVKWKGKPLLSALHFYFYIEVSENCRFIEKHKKKKSFMSTLSAIFVASFLLKFLLLFFCVFAVMQLVKVTRNVATVSDLARLALKMAKLLQLKVGRGYECVGRRVRIKL